MDEGDGLQRLDHLPVVSGTAMIGRLAPAIRSNYVRNFLEFNAASMSLSWTNGTVVTRRDENDMVPPL